MTPYLYGENCYWDLAVLPLFLGNEERQTSPPCFPPFPFRIDRFCGSSIERTPLLSTQSGMDQGLSDEMLVQDLSTHAIDQEPSRQVESMGPSVPASKVSSPDRPRLFRKRVPKVTLKRARLRKAFRWLKFRKQPKKAKTVETPSWEDDDVIQEAQRMGWGIASIIFAGASFLFFWLPFGGAALALIGLLCGLVGLGADNPKIPAIIGLIGSFIMLLIGVGWTLLFIYLWTF